MEVIPEMKHALDNRLWKFLLSHELQLIAWSVDPVMTPPVIEGGQPGTRWVPRRAYADAEGNLSFTITSMNGEARLFTSEHKIDMAKFREMSEQLAEFDRTQLATSLIENLGKEDDQT